MKQPLALLALLLPLASLHAAPNPVNPNKTTTLITALRSGPTAVSGASRQKEIHSSSMKRLLNVPLLLAGIGRAHAATPSATMNSFYSYQCNFDNQSVSSWTTYGGTWSIIDQNSSY